MNAYSQDLRRRIFSYSLTHTVRDTARVFHVSPSTVQALRRLFCETGALAPRPPGAARPRTISPEGELYVQLLLREQVDLTLRELCTRYTDPYGVPVSLSTMHAPLKRLGLTRKKKTTYDPRKTRAEVQADTDRYHRQVDSIPLDQRLYLDETGSRLNLTLPYGRAPRGERAVDTKPAAPGEVVSTVAVLTEHGLAGQFCYRGEWTAERFVAYLTVYLCPLLLAGPKVLILDPHPVHRAGIVQAFLADHHIPYIYLPPCSPELNPIEEAFSKAKHFLKKCKARTLEQLFNALNQFKTLITPSDAQGYFQHAEDFSQVSV
jgi:transposase